MHPSRPNK
jgi:hypothetical protein